MMKKILSLLLTILLLLSSMLFVPACTDRDSAQDGTQSNTSEETTSPPIQDYDKPTSAPLEIVKDGVPQYTLVTPKNASAAVMSARTTLVRAIQELCIAVPHRRRGSRQDKRQLHPAWHNLL